jgi:hypothetical protein
LGGVAKLEERIREDGWTYGARRVESEHGVRRVGWVDIRCSHIFEKNTYKGIRGGDIIYEM